MNKINAFFIFVAICGLSALAYSTDTSGQRFQVGGVSKLVVKPGDCVITQSFMFKPGEADPKLLKLAKEAEDFNSVCEVMLERLKEVFSEPELQEFVKFREIIKLVQNSQELLPKINIKETLENRTTTYQKVKGNMRKIFDNFTAVRMTMENLITKLTGDR